METNSLHLNVQSDTVEKGADRLDHLSRSAAKAERASKGLATSQAASSVSAGKAATAQGAAATATGGLATAQTTATATGSKLAVSQSATAVASGRAATGATAAATATGGLATAQTGATATTRALTGATAGLGATLGTMLAPLLAILAPILALKKLLGSTVELQDFQAQLKTATGSVENAGVAFEALEDFASTTPFALEQSLDAFIKLTNLGLTPSERALTSYGNTASAMGKDLTQLIEAVADATTGEFERLKEFGIKASSEGDRVKFTFRGVTTEIGKNAAEIEEYLTGLGENEFAGAMSDRMATVGGQMSNLGDLWNQLFRTISELGVGSAIGATLQIGINALSELIAILESGQFEASVASWTTAFEGWASDFEATLGFVTDLFGLGSDEWAEDGKAAWEEIIRALKLVPATIRYWVQRMGIEIYAVVSFASAAAQGIYTVMVAKFDELLATAKNFGSAIGSALNPFDDTGFLESFQQGANKQAEIARATAQKISKAYEDAAASVEITKQARIETLGEITDEFGDAVDRVDTLTQKSKDLRAAYDAEKAAKDKARASGEAGDRLAGFKIQPKTTPGGGATSSGSSRGGASRSRGGGGGSAGPSGPTEFEKLVTELRKEEQAIEESYLKRLELVRNNTAAGSEARLELEDKLQRKYQEDIEKFSEKTIAEVDVERNGFDLKLYELEDYYEKRREAIINNETLIEEEKTALLLNLETERQDLIQNLQLERAKQGLKIADDYFGNFAQLAQSNNKKLAGIGKAALAAQKAIAITQATIKTYESATSAYAAMASIPYVGPALGAAAAGAAIAAGLANVAAISSSNTNVGNFAMGGILGGQSATGDAVTFQGNRGEVVMNFEQQRRLLNIANGGANAGGGGGGSGNVTIINQTSTPVEAETRVNANGDREIIIREAVNRTKAELANEAETGAGVVVPSLQRNFGLRRTGTN